jgi:hypothetical protein
VQIPNERFESSCGGITCAETEEKGSSENPSAEEEAIEDARPMPLADVDERVEMLPGGCWWRMSGPRSGWKRA